ncbi:hypothetical protein ACWEQC_43680, partial [Streptomyces shenzhenensis]
MTTKEGAGLGATIRADDRFMTTTFITGANKSDPDAGPPNGGTVNACWQDGWKCQHAWPEI